MTRGRQNFWTPQMVATMMELKKGGYSNAVIAERLGVSPQAVRSKQYKKGAKDD